jgi:hypothetical protein
LLRNLKRRPRPTQGCRADDDDVDDLIIFLIPAEDIMFQNYEVYKAVKFVYFKMVQIPMTLYLQDVRLKPRNRRHKQLCGNVRQRYILNCWSLC